MVFNMTQEDPGKVDYSSIGGLSDQIRWVLVAAAWGAGGEAPRWRLPVKVMLSAFAAAVRKPLCSTQEPSTHLYSPLSLSCHPPACSELREAVELPLINPELFARVGIKPPTGVLLYGPPGTGKTLLAKAIASNIEANFLKVVASGVVDKYIGESARVIRERFGCVRACLRAVSVDCWSCHGGMG